METTAATKREDSETPVEQESKRKKTEDAFDEAFNSSLSSVELQQGHVALRTDVWPSLSNAERQRRLSALASLASLQLSNEASLDSKDWGSLSFRGDESLDFNSIFGEKEATMMGRLGASFLKGHASGILHASLSLTISPMLYLFGSSVHSEGINALTEVCVENGRAVRAVDLRGTGITDKGALALARALSKSKTWRAFDLSLSKVGDVGAEALAGMLEGQKEWHTFRLSVMCSDFGVAALANALQENKEWHTFAPCVANMSDRGAEVLASVFKNNRDWKVFDSGTALLDDCLVTTLADSLRRSKQWRVFRLGTNSLTGTDLFRLLEALGKNDNWKVFDLGDNQISSAGILSLASALSKNHAWQCLVLGDNDLGDEGVVALARALEANETWETVVLPDNKLGPNGAAVFVDGWRRLGFPVSVVYSGVMKMCYQEARALVDNYSNPKALAVPSKVCDQQIRTDTPTPQYQPGIATSGVEVASSSSSQQVAASEELLRLQQFVSKCKQSLSLPEELRVEAESLLNGMDREVPASSEVYKAAGKKRPHSEVTADLKSRMNSSALDKRKTGNDDLEGRKDIASMPRVQDKVHALVKLHSHVAGDTSKLTDRARVFYQKSIVKVARCVRICHDRSVESFCKGKETFSPHAFKCPACDGKSWPKVTKVIT